VADAGFEGLALVLGGSFAEIDIDGTTVRAGGAASLPVVGPDGGAGRPDRLRVGGGVPGSIGGAVRMNAGGHGSDMAASLLGIRVVDLRTGEDVEVDGQRPRLGYRTSALRASQVVVRADLGLAPGDPEAGEPPSPRSWPGAGPTSPAAQNAGSVFTNPPGDSAGRSSTTPGAGACGSAPPRSPTKHANFIQADDGGSADDVLALMAEVQRRVREHSGVDLHPETHLVGFDPNPPAEVEG
jgi:UDP-N-acetylmuramate dehydrogenase